MNYGEMKKSSGTLQTFPNHYYDPSQDDKNLPFNETLVHHSSAYKFTNFHQITPNESESIFDDFGR